MLKAGLPMNQRMLGFSAAVLGFGLFAASPASAGPAPPAVTVPAVDLSKYPRLRPYRTLPPLPVRALPYAVIEPRRDVPAHAWLSPYCVAWDDGVESCARGDGKADQPGTCRMRTDGAGSRGPVACTGYDIKAMMSVCANMVRVDASASNAGPSMYRTRFTVARRASVWTIEEAETDLDRPARLDSPTRISDPARVPDAIRATIERAGSRAESGSFAPTSQYVCLKPYKQAEARDDVTRFVPR